MGTAPGSVVRAPSWPRGCVWGVRISTRRVCGPGAVLAPRLRVGCPDQHLPGRGCRFGAGPRGLRWGRRPGLWTGRRLDPSLGGTRISTFPASVPARSSGAAPSVWVRGIWAPGLRVKGCLKPRRCLCKAADAHRVRDALRMAIATNGGRAAGPLCRGGQAPVRAGARRVVPPAPRLHAPARPGSPRSACLTPQMARRHRSVGAHAGPSAFPDAEHVQRSHRRR